MCNPKVRKAHHSPIIFSSHCTCCDLVISEKLHCLSFGLIINNKRKTEILSHNTEVLLSWVSYMESPIGHGLTLRMPLPTPGPEQKPMAVMCF